MNNGNNNNNNNGTATSEKEVRHGFCSNWLAALPLHHTIEITKCARSHFHLPISSSSSSSSLSLSSSPILMIGTGTGLSPFIGFINERKKETLRNTLTCVPGAFTDCPISKKLPLWWMIGGCRNELDVSFDKELKKFVTSKNGDESTRLNMAYSRTVDSNGDATGKYVQDVVLEHAIELKAILNEQNGIVYVCGSHAMAMDVKNSLTKIVGGLDRLNFLINNQQYLEESWG